MKPYWTVPLACAVLSSLLMVPDVHAQFGGGRGSGGMGGGRHSDQSKGCDSGEKAGTHKTPSDAPQEMMSRDQLEYRLGTLQVDLHLTPDQATLWQSFSDRVLALQADQTRLRNRAPLSVTATALQSVGSGIKPIATAVDRTRNRLTALEDIETASRSLYQSLQADQKTMADLRIAEFLTPLLRT